MHLFMFSRGIQLDKLEMVVLEVLSFKFYAEHSLTSYDSKLFSILCEYSICIDF